VTPAGQCGPAVPRLTAHLGDWKEVQEDWPNLLPPAFALPGPGCRSNVAGSKMCRQTESPRLGIP
jgi:hypothetical protein